MNVNSTFFIGKDHIVCEDYALADKFLDTGYAVVCDGCSASPDVDFGARCLAMSAKREIRLAAQNALLFDGKNVIANAQRVMDIFPYLSPQFLDTTLLVAIVKDKKLTVYMWGDGVMVHRRKNETVAVHVQLSSGAPDYLSYHLDPIRKDSYLDLKNNIKEISIYNGDKIDRSRTGDYNPFDPFIWSTEMGEGETISVISDGINSFRKADNSPIAWTDLIDEFTGFKTFEGEFVLRRISAFKRKCLKEGITHSDDISIASINI